MRLTMLVVAVVLVAGVAMAIGWWVYGVLGWLEAHRVAEPWTLLPEATRQMGKHPELRRIALKSLMYGMGPAAVVLAVMYVLAPSGMQPRVVRGSRIVTAWALRGLTREQPLRYFLAQVRHWLGGEAPVCRQIEIGGVAVPVKCEEGHFLMAGSTGTGKTTAMDEMMAWALRRGDRLIVIDPNGHALARFGRKGDRVLNPFDIRSPGWSPFNEIRRPYDYDRVAQALIPDDGDAASRSWRGYARTLLAETMRMMAQEGSLDTPRLLEWLTKTSPAELGQFLAGTVASRQFEPGAERALASTLFILGECLAPLQYVRPGSLSVRTWLETERGNLYITWREDMRASLKPLVSAWTDLLVSSILTLPATANPRRLWFFLDELASLSRLMSLEDALTKGRKHGLRVVAGLQSVAQLDAIYGNKPAESLRSCFRNLLALGSSNSDPATAHEIARALGESMVERESVTYGQAGKSVSLQRSKEYAVLASELTALPERVGYLKFVGHYPIGKVRLKPGDYPVRVQAMVERQSSTPAPVGR